MRVSDRHSTTVTFNKFDAPVVEFPLSKKSAALSKRVVKSIRISQDDDAPVQFLVTHVPFTGPTDGAEPYQTGDLSTMTWSSDAQRELVELKFTRHRWNLDVAPDSGTRH